MSDWIIFVIVFFIAAPLSWTMVGFLGAWKGYFQEKERATLWEKWILQEKYQQEMKNTQLRKALADHTIAKLKIEMESKNDLPV